MINKIARGKFKGNFAKRCKSFVESPKGRKRMTELIRRCQEDSQRLEDIQRLTPEQWKTPLADF